MNFADMLKAPVVPLVSIKEQRKARAVRTSKIVQAKADGRYRLLMENNKITCAEIARKMGLSHMGCLSSLYKLEKRGLIKRVGWLPRPPDMHMGKGSILWTWVKESDQPNANHMKGV